MNICWHILGETQPREFSLPFLLAVVFATAMVLMSTRRRMRKNQTRDAQKSDRKSGARATRIAKRAATIRTGNAIETEASSAMLELQAYSRQVQAQIDNRFQKLEIAAHRADEKIAELRQLINQARSHKKAISPSAEADPKGVIGPLPS